jgi:hypothetical protein
MDWDASSTWDRWEHIGKVAPIATACIALIAALVAMFTLRAQVSIWPAAGSVDTEIGCFREPEASDAEAQVQSRVQDRGGTLGA